MNAIASDNTSDHTTSSVNSVPKSLCLPLNRGPFSNSATILSQNHMSDIMPNSQRKVGAYSTQSTMNTSNSATVLPSMAHDFHDRNNATATDQASARVASFADELLGEQGLSPAVKRELFNDSAEEASRNNRNDVPLPNSHSDSTLLSMRNPKRLCENLNNLLRRTLISFCDANVDYQLKLEVMGSIHIRADNIDLGSFLLNEKSLRGPATAGFENVKQLSLSTDEKDVLDYGAFVRKEPLVYNNVSVTAATPPGPTAAVSNEHHPPLANISSFRGRSFTNVRGNRSRGRPRGRPTASRSSAWMASPLKAQTQKPAPAALPKPSSSDVINVSDGEPEVKNEAEVWNNMLFGGEMGENVKKELPTNPLGSLLSGASAGLAAAFGNSGTKEDQDVKPDLSPNLKLRSQTAFLCSICSQEFPSGVELQAHVETSHQNQCYTCPMCKIVLKTKDGFNNHMNTKHYKNKIYKCTMCKEHFFSRQQLHSHKVKHHKYVAGCQ